MEERRRGAARGLPGASASGSCPCGSGRGAQDGGQLAGLADRRSQADDGPAGALDQPEPVEALAHLLGGDAYLVDEVVSALRGPGFLVVGTTTRRRADHLSGEM